MVCTFFGHRDAPKETEPILYAALKDLIECKNVDMFYVGNNGSFDYMVKRTVKKLKSEYPHIDYAVVLARLPGKQCEFDADDYSDTIYPEGLENVPPKFAIDKRNRWMIMQADYVVTYVKYSFGGAAKFKELAEKRGKCVVNLADLE